MNAMGVPSQVPQLIYGFCSHLTWDVGAAASSTLEASFYASLRGGVHNIGRLLNWIRETSIARIHVIQAIFNTLNAGIILYTAHQLVSEVCERFSVSTLLEADSYWIMKSVSFVTLAGAVVTFSIFVAKRFSPPPTPVKQEVKQEGEVIAPEIQEEEVDEEVTTAETFSTQQKIANVLHVTKLVLNVTLACFTKNKLLLAVSLAGSGYSLWKNMQIKWMTFSRSFPGPFPITDIKATYNMLVLPPVKDKDHDDCPICLDRQADIAFCANHLFHQTCMAKLAVNQSRSFIDASLFRRIETDHYRNGIYSHTSHHIKTEIPEENLPQCSICRVFPQQNDCDFLVNDAFWGKKNSSVTIIRQPVDRQYLFENIYAIYNTAQAALSYLQTYPELAVAIFKIQEVLLITDFIGYGMTAYYLYKKISQKYKLENSIKFKVAAVATLVAAAALSYLFVFQLNAYLRSAIILKNVLHQLPVSPELLKGIEVGWTNPLTQQLMQCLYINRIVSLVALTFFSNQKKTNLLSIATQLMSFAGISNLNWIEFSQTFEWPLRKIAKEGGKLLGRSQESLKNLTLTTRILVDPKGNLQSAMQSIYDYSNSFFKMSTWENYWLVSFYNGLETDRLLYYKATLQSNPLATILPYIKDFSVRATDVFYGRVGIEVVQ